MLICPHKGSKAWQDLVSKIGETNAYTEFVKNKYDIPDASNFKQLDEKDIELSKLVADTKLFLEKKLAILRNKQVTNKREKEVGLERIIKNMEALDNVESINIFIEDSYNKIKLAEEQFNNLIKNKDNLSRHEMIDRLSSFNDFANGYSILDEISKSDIEDYFSNPEKGLKEVGSFSLQDKLNYSLMARDKIKQRYLKQGIPLLADHLLEFKSESLNEKAQKEIKELNNRINLINKGTLSKEKKEKRIEELNNRIEELKGLSVDRQTLIKQLQIASKDEGAIEYLFNPLISSSDSTLALFAKSIKHSLEDARLKDIKFNKEISKEFNEYSKKQSNKDNPEKFNEGLYEELELPSGVDSEGKTTYSKQMAFIQKYDISSFEKAKNKFFKEVGPKPENFAKLQRWNQQVAKWFSENTQPKNQSEIDEILVEKEKELKTGIITKEEHQEWLDNVISKYKDEITYKRELSEPSNKYLNERWTSLYSEDGLPSNFKGKYHQFLLNKYLSDQEKLSENFRKGFILPSIQKEGLERLQTNGLVNTVKTKVKESAFKQSYDTEYGLADLGDSEAKFLPVFHTQFMDSKDISLDLTSSIIKFSSMVNRYEALNNINAEINLTKTVIGERSVIETNSKDQKILDAFAKKMGYEDYIKKNGETFSQKHLDAFIDMIVYGEMQKAESLFGMDAGKLVNTFTGFSAVTTIAVDLLKGVANNLQGNIQNRIEASNKEYFTKNDLLAGKLYYTKSIPSFLSDFGKISSETLPSQLVELYDAIQGKFKDENGRNITGSIAKKLFKTNTLFFNQNFAEHELQISAFFGVLNNKKIKTKEGQEISLLDAYKKYGIDKIEENTNFTEKQRKELQDIVHGISKRTQGVYNEFDRGIAQRYALGRLAIMYRKHLVPGYKNRFKKLSGNQEFGGLSEGYYITFWNTFVRDLRDFKFNMINNWSSYTEFEKGQVKRTLAEVSFILALTILGLGIKKLGDDDKSWKKNYAYNFMLYQATRMRSETAQYISPTDAYRVVKSPSAMSGTLDRAVKFTNQMLPWNITEKYKKKTGVWDKGDNKAWAYFLKLMGYSGYNLKPEEAVKSFNSTLIK